MRKKKLTFITYLMCLWYKKVCLLVSCVL